MTQTLDIRDEIVQTREKRKETTEKRLEKGIQIQRIDQGLGMSDKVFQS